MQSPCCKGKDFKPAALAFQIGACKTIFMGSDRDNLKEIALLFLKLGITGFGGPAAHIAMMEEETVRKRKWITEQQFLDFLGATNLIPGPNSTEMAIHIGGERGGRLGLIVAGICFILPAMLIVMLVAWFYKTYGELPQVQGVLYGVKPVIIAVIAQAVWNLTQKTMKRTALIAFAAFAAIASIGGMPELAVLIIVGAMAIALRASAFKGPTTLAVTVVPFALSTLFLFFLKVGSVLYGSGYVLLAFLQGELVARYGWLTQAQLLDATAVGQFTPGPVFTTATFIGYFLAGTPGAIVATIGIFLPSFVFVALSKSLVPAIRKSIWAGAFLDGVNAASLGLMAAVVFHLGREAIVDSLTFALALLSVFLLVRLKINSVWVVLIGAICGLAGALTT